MILLDITEIGILADLLNLSPVIAVLVGFIVYLIYENRDLKAKNTEKENEIKELNEYFRESEKDNLEVLNGVNNTMDKLIDKQDNFDKNLIREMENMKQYIDLKIKK